MAVAVAIGGEGAGMKSDKVILIEALMKAHNAFIKSMSDSGYHIFFDDKRNGTIYKNQPVGEVNWPIGKVTIRWDFDK